MMEQFNGIVTPLVTFFNKDYSINMEYQTLLTKHVLKNGSDVLFLCGSTGEGQFIELKHFNSIAGVLKAASAAMVESKMFKPVIMGLFGNDAGEVLGRYDRLMQIVEDLETNLNIDAIVISPPLDVKVDDDYLLKYFSEIIENIKKPVFLYNNPAKFGNNTISMEIHEKLLDSNENIVGIKDSSPSMEYKKEIIEMLKHEKNINFYTGKEGDFFKCLDAAGNRQAVRIGAVPSISNLLSLPSQIYNSYINGDIEQSKTLQEKLNDIRNRLYHVASQNGKAQRGIKFSLINLYYKDATSREIVVSPDLELEIKEEEKKEMSKALDEAIKNKYLVKL
ncbi:MAG: dihydrodipicolinate synthase family protein [Promethearchaeota archaeon]